MELARAGRRYGARADSAGRASRACVCVCVRVRVD